MSYILDALKRAERERKQGQVSVLDEIPTTTINAEPKRRLPPRWLAAGVGLVLVALLAYALLARRHHPEASAAAPAPAVAAVVAPPASVAPPPKLAPLDAGPHEAPPQAPTATIEDGAKIATLDDVYSEPPPPGQPPDQQHDQAAAPAEQPMNPPPGPPPGGGDRGQIRRPQRPPVVTIPAPDAAADQSATANAAPAPAGNDAAPDNSTATTSASAEPADAGAPPPASSQDQAQQGPTQQRQLREMPENYRANFPAFTVDVHAYNNNPQKRFVLVSGKRYHEGDTMAEGPRIIAIVPEGLVLDWQGQQVLYAIAR